MIYCSTGNLERLFFHVNGNLEERHWVDMEMSNCGPTFAVTICCDEDWIWEFKYDKTNYDLVKHMIMDCIFEAESVGELIDAMDEVFEECFDDIVVNVAELQEDEIEFECDGDCDNCMCSAINGCEEDVEIEIETDDSIDKLILTELKKINEKLDKGV